MNVFRIMIDASFALSGERQAQSSLGIDAMIDGKATAILLFGKTNPNLNVPVTASGMKTQRVLPVTS